MTDNLVPVIQRSAKTWSELETIGEDDYGRGFDRFKHIPHSQQISSSLSQHPYPSHLVAVAIQKKRCKLIDRIGLRLPKGKHTSHPVFIQKTKVTFA